MCLCIVPIKADVAKEVRFSNFSDFLQISIDSLFFVSNKDLLQLEYHDSYGFLRL